MEVRCDRCRARYVIADDKVGDEGLPVRCSGCGHVFRVKKKAVVVTVAVKPEELAKIAPVSTADLDRSAAAAGGIGGGAPDVDVGAAGGRFCAGGAAAGFSVRRRGDKIRTFKDLSELQKWVVEGNAQREDEVSEQAGPWQRLRELPELQPFFAVVDRARHNDAALRSRVQATLIDFPATHSLGRVAVPGNAGATEPGFAPPHAVEDSGPVLPGHLGSVPSEPWEKTVPAAPGKEPAWAADAKAGRGPRPVTSAARAGGRRRRSLVPVVVAVLAALALGGGAAVYFFWPTLQPLLPPALLSFLGERGRAPAESQVPVAPSPAAAPSAQSGPPASPSLTSGAPPPIPQA